MAANKGNAMLINILNKGIHQARKSGVLDKISKKWLGTKFGPQPSFLEQYLWPMSVAAGSLLILSLGVWGWNVRLRTLVRKKTAEIAHSEEALRESEEKFRSIFNNSLDGIVYATPDGRIIAANPSVCEMLGWSEQELCEGGRNLIVDATDPRLLKAIEEPTRSGRFRGEINHKRKDGTIFPVEISKTLFSLANGAMRTSLIFRDISTRKQAEESRRREHTFRDTIIDNVTEGLCVCHETTEYPFVRFTIWNNQMTNITGYTMEEINRRGWYQTLYLDPELQARAMERMKQMRQEENLRAEEWEITRADGMQRVLNISTSSVESDDGQIHVLALMHDITERKAAEEKLNKIMREQQIILDNANIGISLVVDRKQVWVNRKSVEMFQYKKEEIEGQPTRKLYSSQEAYERLGRDAYPVLAQGGTYETEQQLIRRDGTPIWIKYNGKAIDASDLSMGTIWLLEDVTEQKRIEEERKQWERQQQQIQKADSLNRMAGAIAHHYNNMLGAVMGNLEMAMEDLPQQGEAFTHLSAALQATSKAAEVSGLMLTYLGQAITKLDLLDLSDVCSQTLPALRIIVKEKIVLDTDVPSPGPAINANANQIQRILKNLVANASEAIGDRQGTIHLQVKTVALADIPTAHRFPIDWKPEDNAFACLEVKDSGSGISDEEIEHIFDPFFSSKFTGRGLGLPVVLGILRTHRGVVTVESDPDRGSAFRVFFPLSAEQIPFRAEDAAHDLNMAGSGTVLLVEDEDIVCEMTSAMLMRLGFTVRVAQDGIEAVETFRQYQDEIQIVLCDLTMPRMDGWETLAALRALVPHIPIILTSGYDEAHVMQDERPERPQAFLQKPFNKQELQNALERAFKSSVH